MLKNICLKNVTLRKLFLYNTPKFLHKVKGLHQNEQFTCWKCGSLLNSNEIFCVKCKIIQQPFMKDNYFKILGIEESYNVDLNSLTAKYRQLQRFLHPDKYSNKSKEEKQISAEYSSIVNNAYNTLQSPINRGIHLLAIKGEKIDENDKNTDQSFLLEIMELNEQVADAQTPEQLIRLNKKNRKDLEDIGMELSRAFDCGDILKAKKILIKMKYYVSVSTQINSILRERGIVE